MPKYDAGRGKKADDQNTEKIVTSESVTFSTSQEVLVPFTSRHRRRRFVLFCSDKYLVDLGVFRFMLKSKYGAKYASGNINISYYSVVFRSHKKTWENSTVCISHTIGLLSWKYMPKKVSQFRMIESFNINSPALFIVYRHMFFVSTKIVPNLKIAWASTVAAHILPLSKHLLTCSVPYFLPHFCTFVLVRRV